MGHFRRKTIRVQLGYALSHAVRGQWRDSLHRFKIALYTIAH